MTVRDSRVLSENAYVTGWMRCKDALTNAVGWFLERTKAPAVMKEFEFVDPDTDGTVCLSIGKRYAVLSVGSRRLYFDRLTGKFDGTSAPARTPAPSGGDAGQK